MVQVHFDKKNVLDTSTVTYWGRKFKTGFMSVIDEDHEGRLPFVITEDNVTVVKRMIL